MSKSNSFFAFLAGAIAGAALFSLAKSEMGEAVVNDIKEKGSEAFNKGRAVVLEGLDKVEDALKRRHEESE